MTLQGYVKDFRIDETHWLHPLQEGRAFTKYEAWKDLIKMVNHEEKKTLIDSELVPVRRGEKITSIKKLENRWKWSNTKINNFFKLLESDGMIKVHRNAGKNIGIKVLNYEKWQGMDGFGTPGTHRGNISETFPKHINKNDKNEQEGGGATLEDVYDFYADNFGMLSSFISEDIGIWCNDLSPDLVIAAMKIALRQGKPWGYARGPLKAWYKAGVKTLEDARAFEKQRQRDMNKNKGFSYHQSKEEKRKKMREKILEESE